MRKYLILLFIISFSWKNQAQMIVKKYDGTVINNGDIITFTTTNVSVAKMKFKVYNTSSTPINVKIRCNSILNATGANMELCFGTVCESNISQGMSYPSIPVVINGNGENGNFDSFWNSDTGTGTFPIDYSFRFYMLDNEGVATGNSINFTYRYNPNLSTKDFEKLDALGIQLKNTLINQELEVEVVKSLMLSVFDVSGKLITQEVIQTGSNVIDFRNITSGMYIATFMLEDGNNTSVKIVKR